MERKDRKEIPGAGEPGFDVGRPLTGTASRPESEASAALLRELVSHLRQNRSELREEWARRITEAQLLTAMTKDEDLYGSHLGV